MASIGWHLPQALKRLYQSANSVFEPFKIPAAAAGLLILSTSSAFAVDVRNDDKTNYSITVDRGRGAFLASLTAWSKSTARSICRDSCTIYVNGKTIQANEGDVVVIKNGVPVLGLQVCPVQVCTPEGCTTQVYSAPVCSSDRLDLPQQR